MDVPVRMTGAVDEAGDGGAGAIGADDERGPRGEPVVGVREPDADDAAAFPDEVGDGGFVDEVGSGVGSSVGEQRVEDGAPWRVERVDAVGGFDVDRQSFAAVVERRSPNGGRPGGDDVVEQAPTGELDHTAAHQGVGGHRVGSRPRTVEDQDASPVAGEEHPSGPRRRRGHRRR